MARITEVRVHGVSGTPPAAMLRTEPRLIESRPRPLAEDKEMVKGVDVAVKRDDAAYQQTLDVAVAADLSRNLREKRRPVEVSLHPASEAPFDDGLAEPDRVTAYNWSKLTSGRARHALWLLLLPYTFMNVAGWMLPARVRAGRPQRPEEIGAASARLLDVLVRVGGGVVTGIFTLFASTVTLDLWASKCRPGTATCSFASSFPTLDPGWWLILGTVFALVLTVLVGFWIGWDRRRGRQADDAVARLVSLGGRIGAVEDAEDDPVASLRLTDSSIWQRRLLTRHLIWVHLGSAAVVLAWVLVRIQMNSGTAADPTASVTPWSLWVVSAGTLVVGSGLVAASYSRHGSGQRYEKIAAIAGLAGIVAYAAAAIDVSSLSDRMWSDIDVEQALAEVSVGSIAVLAVIALVIFLVGAFRKRVSTAGSAAMVVLAGLVGASFGAGAYTLAQRMLISGRESVLVMRDGSVVAAEDVLVPLGGVDWAAVGFLVFVLATIVAALLIIIGARREIPGPLVMEGLRNATTRARGLLGTAALVALAGGALFIVIQLVTDPEPGPDGRARGNIVESPFELASGTTKGILLVLAIVVVVAAVVALFVYMGWVWGVGAFAALGGVLVALSFGWLTEVKLLGVVIRLDNARELTVSLALLVPATFIVSRMLSMFRNREQRRGIAILWDLGSFWQRWYHPFAAPTYGPVAVPDLAAYVRESCAGSDKLILGAHSQGTVIAMAALLTFDEKADKELLERLGFLSYGSPIEHLYVTLFPAFFDDEAIRAVMSRLDGGRPRWRNLWRQSDPIGGDIAQLAEASERIPNDDPDVADGHSSYEKTSAYRRARAALIDAMGPPEKP